MLKAAAEMESGGEAIQPEILAGNSRQFWQEWRFYPAKNLLLALSLCRRWVKIEQTDD